MAQAKRHVLHPVVGQVLADFVEMPRGMALIPDRLRHWAQTLQAHPDRPIIGRQLVAVAIEFSKTDFVYAAQQLVALATIVLDPHDVQNRLVSGGVDREQSRELMAKANQPSRNLSVGLAPPSGGITSGSGRSLRGKNK